MDTRLPTAAEINVFGSLDEISAVEKFLGKDLKQAELLFRENFLRAQEELSWMGPSAFGFFVQAAVNYMLSIESAFDADAANSFCRLIESRLDRDPAAMASAGSIVRKGILGILENFGRYDCEVTIYGDVAERYRLLLTKLVP